MVKETFQSEWDVRSGAVWPVGVRTILQFVMFWLQHIGSGIAERLKLFYSQCGCKHLQNKAEG